MCKPPQGTLVHDNSVSRDLERSFDVGQLPDGCPKA